MHLRLESSSSETLSRSADLRRFSLDYLIQNDWTRKRRKGIGKRRCQTSPKDPSWQHPRYHQASYSTSCSSWWCETYLWTHLRGNPWSSQSFPWECHPWCSHLHRACQEEDCHCNGCRLRSEEARTHPVRIRWIRCFQGTHKNGYFYSHKSLKELQIIKVVNVVLKTFTSPHGLPFWPKSERWVWDFPRLMLPLVIYARHGLT